MDVATAIRTEMAKKKLNGSELARMTGYTPQYIHYILNGQKRWNETSLTRICSALDLEIRLTGRNAS